MWVADSNDDKVFAYTLSSKARDINKEFNLDAPPNSDVEGLWSNGTTMWVVDDSDNKSFAYTLATGARDPAKDIPLYADNSKSSGLWSDGTTIWVADYLGGKVYSYNMAPSTAGSTTLTDLTVTHGASRAAATLRPAFTFDRDLYRAAVPNSASQVTITARRNNNSATITYLDANSETLTDADGVTTGHQVAVGVGETTVKVKVSSGSNSLTYAVVVERDSADDWGWTPTKDFNELTGGNPTIRGVWGNATHVYVAHWLDPKIYAYSRSDGSRAESKDITLDRNTRGEALSNEHTRGIWSDGTTLWALDQVDEKLYVYPLDGATRDSSKDIDLNLSSRYGAIDVWSDGTTIWVSDHVDDKLYAYKLDIAADGTVGNNHGDRDPSKDIALHVDNATGTGIWSNGTTMWVTDFFEKRVYAYALDGGARDISREFDLESDKGGPRALWADGETMWVMASVGKKLYSYSMPLPIPTVSIADGRGSEGGKVQFTVSLSGPSRKTVSVDYRTGPGGDGKRATAGIDYTGARDTLTFAPGETSKTISVAATADDVDDADETFIVTLSRPVNAELGISRATGTINEGANPSLIIAVRKEGHETNRNVREDGSDHPFYQRTVMVAMYNLEDASWEGRSPADPDFKDEHDYNVDANSRDYVHRLDIKGGDTIGNIYERTPCEGPRDPIPGKPGTYALNGVNRDIWRVNENPETRSSGPVDNGDETDDDGCLHNFTVRATVWSAADYQAEGTAADPVTTLTCTFKGNDDGSDDFRPLPLDSATYPDSNKDPANYYHAFLVCTDSNRDDQPDNAPALPPLDWEPPEDPGQVG